MHGMFRANGGCGYVKKPDFILKPGSDDEIFDPRVRLTVKTTLKVSAPQHFYPSRLSVLQFPLTILTMLVLFAVDKVTVYMGEGWYYDFHHTHFDAYSPPDFYTRVC